VKGTQVHWLEKAFYATVVTQKFAKITILLLQCEQILYSKGYRHQVIDLVQQCSFLKVVIS